jgi:two-component system cell cycle sensor histidine kinase/response regulator CckA
MGNVSLVLLDTDKKKPQYEKLKNIEKLVESGSKLTSQLLGYAREGRYEIKPLSLNRLVKETSETFGTAKKEIRIIRDLAPDLLTIEADQGQIEQALWNLYVNAADAITGSGDLILKTCNVTNMNMAGKQYNPRSGNYVLLTVTDSGIGMDKKTMNHIFEPFFTTKGVGKGTGLGLASVYGIIKAHDGYIDVESQKGHGTTFKIYLPVSNRKVTGKAELAQEPVKGSETVLLVDDEETVIDVGRQMLERMGYTVLAARSGKDAIELYRAHKDAIHIVILDLIMPEMSGGETYDEIKKINPYVKVLLSSGYSKDSRATEILARGCNGFIQKPYTMKGLSLRIREILK